MRPTFCVQKRLLSSSRQPGNRNIRICEPMDRAAWLWHPDVAAETPAFLCFGCSFEGDGSALRIHVTADQHFVLFVDGQRIARGPDRSDVQHWSFATYDLELPPGEHRVEAMVWWLGDHAPMSIMSHRGGFALWAEGEYSAALSTGIAPWQVLLRRGWSMHPSTVEGYHVIGDSLHIDAAAWHAATSEWVEPAVVRGPVEENATGVDLMGGWRCYPSTLPALLDQEVTLGRIRAVIPDPSPNLVIEQSHTTDAEIAGWQALLEDGQAVTVPARQRLAVLWDFEDYVCGYHAMQLAGGAGSQLTCSWAESLFEPGTDRKGHRTKIVGKEFRGFGHRYVADGGHRDWSSHWWCSGRYLLLEIETEEEPLRIGRLSVQEVRYPLVNEAKIDTGHDELQGIIPLCMRALQSCAFDHFMDCPYYEQMMYVGDTRLELLTTYAITRDTRLQQRCIDLFDFSRRAFGFVAERYPARQDQQSATFAAIWVLCVRDFALWRDDPDWVRERMIGVRANLDCFLPYRTDAGLVRQLPGWSFVDWVAAWDFGRSPGDAEGCCGPSNLLYLLALQAAAELETMLGSPALAEHYRTLAGQSAEAIRVVFWDETRELFADDPGHQYYSQHSQSLAVLAGLVSDADAPGLMERTLASNDLARCTLYFQYYLFEALYRCGNGPALLDQYQTWFELRRLGLYTTVETPEPTRSDCHAWGAHALHHMVCSLAGIRPGSASFRTVRIAPVDAGLPSLNLCIPHPDGEIVVEVRRDDGAWKGTVTLPAGCSGVFVDGDREVALESGTTPVCPA